MNFPINNNLINIVDKANSVFSDSDDITKISSPCYRNIRPVYPVRYAYMNFFTKDLYKPQLPPSIQDLMAATSLEQVGGYTARILREGWVYVKEEAPLKTRGSQSENGILIFKHILNEIESEKEGDIASVSEIFYEYEFNNENNSYQEKKQLCKPCGFLPIKKDVKNISILFSDIPLSKSILKKLNDNTAYRKNIMQFINLDAEEKYTLELNKENLSDLVEDYKIKNEQFNWCYNELELDADCGYQLGYGTTQQSYYIDPEKKDNIFKAYCNKGEKGTLVILHDPVGRQKDILDVYSLLVTYLKSYMESYNYPITIGNYIEALLKNDSSEVRETVRSSLNEDEWNTNWKEIKNNISNIHARTAEILSLYNAFAFNYKLSSEKYDGLKLHLTGLFSFLSDAELSGESYIDEVYIFSGLFFDITNSLQFTELGSVILDRFFNKELTPKSVIEKLQERSSLGKYILTYSLMESYDLLPTVATTMLDTEVGKKAFKKFSDTLPTEDGNLIDDWKDTLVSLRTFLDNKLVENPELKKLLVKSFDKLLIVFGKSFSTSLVYMGNLPKNSSILKGRKLMADFTIEVAKLSGIKININISKLFTGSQLEIELKKIGVLLKDKLRPDNLKMGNRLFNWDKITSRLKNEAWIKLPSIDKITSSLKSVGTKNNSLNGKNIVPYIDKTIPGLAFCVNALIVLSLSNQSFYSRNNPLKARSLGYYAFKIAEGFVATVENSKFTVMGAKQLQKMKLLANNKIIRSIANIPKSPKLRELSIIKSFRFLSTVSFTVLAGISFYEAYNSWRIGNNLNSIFKGISGVGYSLLAIGTLGAIFFELALWPIFIFLGTASMLVGTVGDLATTWGDLEALVKCSFWGNSKKYPFWNTDSISYESKINLINENKKNTLNGFIIESQEFINIFYMPKLEWVYSAKELTIKMELNNFIPYDSQIFYQICRKMTSRIPSVYTEYREKDKLFHYDNSIYKKIDYTELDAEFNENIKNNYIDNNGSSILEMVIKTPENFYYGNEIFFYYRPFEDNIVPLRYDWDDNEISDLEVKHYGLMKQRAKGNPWS